MKTWNFANELARYGPNAGDTAMSLEEARAYCKYVTQTHYENFAVASWLLPKRLRVHFHAVYAYCRWADNLADETGGSEESLRLLSWWRGEFINSYPRSHALRGDDSADAPRPLDLTIKDAERPVERYHAERGNENVHPVMIALRETIRQFHIPLEPFLNLLVAFEQDQRLKQYDTFSQLLRYCQNSANPVGRIVLHLFESYDDERAILSDEICTGLQLANFWQDVARDFRIGRVYLPAEEMERFGVTHEDLEKCRFTPSFADLMKFQVERTQGYFDRGRPLLKLVPRDCRVDLELFLGGGEAILRAIERQNFNVLTHRPVIGKWVKGKLLLRALWNSYY